MGMYLKQEFKDGKLVKRWFMLAEKAHETESDQMRRYYDLEMRKVETAIRNSPRHMRSNLPLTAMRRNYG